MKYRLHHEIKDSFQMISLISDNGIASLNKLFDTHYTRQLVKKQIRIKRKEEKFSFWKKLMETKPGFNKGNNEKKEI